MVTIRKLQPSVRIALPNKTIGDGPGGRIKVVVRRLKDFPPPTPQPTPCVLWQGSTDRDGYGRMKRKVNGKPETVRVTRWVMEQAEGRKLRPDEFILHACDHPLCYRVAHLSVGSAAANNLDMRSKGRGVPPPIHHFRGEAHPMAKLTAAQVRKIRGHYISGLRAKTIAEMFDVSPQTIYKIVKGLTWASGGSDRPPAGASRRSERTPRVNP